MADHKRVRRVECGSSENRTFHVGLGVKRFSAACLKSARSVGLINLRNPSDSRARFERIKRFNVRVLRARSGRRMTARTRRINRRVATSVS